MKTVHDANGVKVYQFRAKGLTSYTAAMMTSGGHTQIPGMAGASDIQARRDLVASLRAQDYNETANALVKAGFLAGPSLPVIEEVSSKAVSAQRLAKMRAATFKARWEIDHAPSALGVEGLSREEASAIEDQFDAAAEACDIALRLLDKAGKSLDRAAYESALSAIVAGEAR